MRGHGFKPAATHGHYRQRAIVVEAAGRCIKGLQPNTAIRPAKIRRLAYAVAMSSPESSRPQGTPTLALDAAMKGDSGSLLRHALWLDAANRAWRAHLPAHLRGHLRLGNLDDDGCLWTLADTPAWAERARLASLDLLNAARASGLIAHKIKVRVAKPQPLPQYTLEKPPTAASVAAVKQIMAILQQDETAD
ncbi:hypothetical protein CO608_02815 [Lysobacteraceae bacterium NML08-0793]|nr:hypothetical protein CO608_02815 [Xanthomonadaceae bacterium NML08-0793]